MEFTTNSAYAHHLLEIFHEKIPMIDILCLFWKYTPSNCVSMLKLLFFQLWITEKRYENPRQLDVPRKHAHMTVTEYRNMWIGILKIMNDFYPQTEMWEYLFFWISRQDPQWSGWKEELGATYRPLCSSVIASSSHE